MIQNTVYQLKISEEVEAEETTQEAPVEDETASQTAMEGLSQTTAKTYHYLEGQDKDYLAKADGFLRFYHINVAIQKVSLRRFVADNISYVDVNMLSI